MAMASIIDSYNKVLAPINAGFGKGAVDSTQIYSDPIGKAHQSAEQQIVDKKAADEYARQLQLLLGEQQSSLTSTQAQTEHQARVQAQVQNESDHYARLQAQVQAQAEHEARVQAGIRNESAHQDRLKASYQSVVDPVAPTAVDPRYAGYAAKAETYERPAMLTLMDWNVANKFPQNQGSLIPEKDLTYGAGGSYSQGYYSPYDAYRTEYNNAITQKLPAPKPQFNPNATLEKQYPITHGGRRAPVAPA